MRCDQLPKGVTVSNYVLTRRSAAFRFALLMVAGTACCTTLYGQTDSGCISGFVLDETGAVIPGVAVSAVDEGRGIRRESETSDTGEFVFRYVDPGMYSLRFEAADFAPLAVDGLEVRVGETATVSPGLVWLRPKRPSSCPANQPGRQSSPIECSSRITSTRCAFRIFPSIAAITSP